MDEIKGIHERLDQMEQRMDEQYNQMMRLIEQLIHMLAENNRALADFRSEVKTEFADIRSEIPGMSTRLTNNEEDLRREHFHRDGESRHFAQSIGILERDVATLKQR